MIIRINQESRGNFCRPSADPLFRSAVMVYGAATLGTVLTGMGKDGLSGAQAIADAGGTIVAQDQESSIVWGMPRTVAEAGICSAVLPLSKMSDFFNKLAKS
ncbi:MAG: CheB methylesterase domain-containing protein [Rhodospirillales bacterium]